ncbi:MAG: hypothetical protein NVSMB52_15290 [Chloroflexota bacterium]
MARNLAIGLQIEQAKARPTHTHEPRAFRAIRVDGLSLFERDGTDIVLHRSAAVDLPRRYALPWTHCAVRLVA